MGGAPWNLENGSLVPPAAIIGAARVTLAAATTRASMLATRFHVRGPLASEQREERVRGDRRERLGGMDGDVYAILQPPTLGSPGARSLGDTYDQPAPLTPEPGSSGRPSGWEGQARGSVEARSGHPLGWEAQARGSVEAREAYEAVEQLRLPQQPFSSARWSIETPFAPPPGLYGSTAAAAEPLAAEQPLIPNKAELSLYIQRLTAREVRLRAKLSRGLLQDIEG